MKPLRIEARSYGPFDRLDVDLPLGAVAVIGPNGAGKSTLVNAIDRALFGSRSMGEWLTTGEVDGAMSLTLEFEHDALLYKVRRTFSSRGRGKPSLDFERLDMDADPLPSGEAPPSPEYESWMPLSRESIKETQSEIERTLGFTRDIFRASAFLVQGGAGSFTDPGLDPRNRKQMLCDLLGLDVYDALLERVRARMISIRDVTTRLSIQVEEAERELERKPGVITQRETITNALLGLSRALEKAEAAHKTATEKLNASREVAAKLTASREVLASRERDLQTATDRRSWLVDQIEAGEAVLKLKAESEALAGRRESIERDLAAAREGEKARDEHRRLTGERDRLVASINELNQKAESLRETAQELETPYAEGERDEYQCDRCGQLLGAESRKVTIKNLRDEAAALNAQAGPLDLEAATLLAASERAAENAARGPNAAKQAELENALRLANEAERTLATIAEREKVVEELAVEFAKIEVRLPELRASCEQAKEGVAVLGAEAPSADLEAAVARAYGILHEARNDVEQAKSRLAVAQAELTRLGKIEEAAKANRAALAEHQAELDVLLLAERAYGKAGIPALVLENRAIPLLEAKANEALSRLGGKTASARIELRTQREKKDGAGVVEALDIMVVTASGYERSFGQWSGGEKTRIDVALRLALMELSGAEMGILILDEIAALDKQGKADLVTLVNDILALGIERVLVVSHEDDLRLAFDNQIELEIIGEERSRVVGAVGAEAVPA